MKAIYALFIFCLFSQLQAQTIKNFNLKDTQNTTHSYEGLKGAKLTVIDFWATWCKPCVKAIPELNIIYDQFKDKGVSFIGINCDGPRSVAKVGPMSKSLQIKYPVVLDMDATVKTQLNLSAFPTLILIDQKGKIVWIHEGFVSGDEKEIIAQIEKYCNEK
ncbi:TlpA disulfide reductase family protein [Flavobacterium sp.]|uniref:TlpA family protein disulfide reductase n=1 Tax=Flavobacterium sp. TaxID=239 RepID=UPI001B4BF33C|nr:TlpA disulfide reductase family protein [Flavobacterium sp.]MBP6182227.1 TlpA family protein disulfide reductase [Flavobacterium sp.]